MSYGLNDRERRRQRQALLGTVKLLLQLAAVIGVGLFSYQLGIERLKQQDTDLRAEIAALRDTNGQLGAAIMQLEAVARTAETRALELERRYAQDVPQGELARMLNMVRDRIAAGVPTDRIAFVLANADRPRQCEEAERRRFVVQTPISQASTNSSIRFGNGAMTVSAEGVSARARDGSPEAWYDPTQPVTVRFIPLGGRNERSASGMLPLNHAMVVNNVEWRFAVHPGQRSFVEVIAERCPFP